MRTPIMAGNWKMNMNNTEACALACAVKEQAGDTTGVEVVLCPPATALTTVVGCVEGSAIEVGAQNMFWMDSGAYTGEISADMIKSTGAKWVIIGHSERRGRFGVAEEGFTEELQKVFGDTDASVNRKITKALESGIKPIACCGELLSEREAGKTDEVVSAQVRAMFEGMCGCNARNVVIAYEPVWAIGTGEVCDAEEADRVCGVIRSVVAEIGGAEVAEAVRILYGGSVKPDNVSGLMAKPNIDGGLVGGASLKADSFVALIEACKPKGGCCCCGQ
ncbi:MAG: triose-phosphate isomerase [Armatimonadetes bacterium]|jgi:triosephosphate isomerase|nr:triose-phosphate isomerase [Armatimonadota bacterium]MDI9583732.1 triose-phosphate isomerase [Acidobacteriota bacterium]